RRDDDPGRAVVAHLWHLERASREQGEVLEQEIGPRERLAARRLDRLPVLGDEDPPRPDERALAVLLLDVQQVTAAEEHRRPARRRAARPALEAHVRARGRFEPRVPRDGVEELAEPLGTGGARRGEHQRGDHMARGEDAGYRQRTMASGAHGRDHRGADAPVKAIRVGVVLVRVIVVVALAETAWLVYPLARARILGLEETSAARGQRLAVELGCF